MPTDTIPSPIPFIRHWAGQAAAGAERPEVLDLACGSGRHGRLFLEAGYPVTFLDRKLDDMLDLAGRPGATVIAADLESGGPWPLAGRKFGYVIVTNYLWRPVMGKILDLVAPGGILLYETFAVGNEAYGRPANPDFLLREGELKQSLPGDFEILQFEQGTVGEPANAVKQRLAARRRETVYETVRADGYRVSDDPAGLDLAMVRDYLGRSYWYEDISDAIVARAARNSISFGLYEPDGRQIGYARMVTDKATYAYLADVFVLEEMQGRGLGQFLMAAVMAHPDLKGLKRYSLATRDAHGLYEKFGFERVTDPSNLMMKMDMEFHLKQADRTD